MRKRVSLCTFLKIVVDLWFTVYYIKPCRNHPPAKGKQSKTHGRSSSQTSTAHNPKKQSKDSCDVFSKDSELWASWTSRKTRTGSTPSPSWSSTTRRLPQRRSKSSTSSNSSANACACTSANHSADKIGRAKAASTAKDPGISPRNAHSTEIPGITKEIGKKSNTQRGGKKAGAPRGKTWPIRPRSARRLLQGRPLRVETSTPIPRRSSRLWIPRKTPLSLSLPLPLPRPILQTQGPQLGLRTQVQGSEILRSGEGSSSGWEEKEIEFLLAIFGEMIWMDR